MVSTFFRCLVQKFQAAAVYASLELPIDPAKVFVHGGSHGGFLTAHAIGQFPVSEDVWCQDRSIAVFSRHWHLPVLVLQSR